MRALERSTLAGLWAAVPTPWRDDGRLDEAALQRNCERLAEAAVAGVYTTDSDGEFYAIEIEEFRALAGTFGRAMEETGIDAAMGVTWCHTQGIVDRMRAACDAGIPNVHVAFPFWMPLASQDVDRFFEDLALAVPEARWIHYAHPQAGPQLSGIDYSRLARQVPDQFIGTKLGTTNVLELTEILLHSSELAHFVVDTTLTVGMSLGARGCYSYWVNTLPRWHQRWMDACIQGDWEEAHRCHMKLMRWELDHIKKLRDAGYRHGIIGKARAALTGLLEGVDHTRPPYYPVPLPMQQELQQAFQVYWAQEIAEEGFGDSMRSRQ